MSLKTEIDNTNTQRENLKTVANKIDNKLVELGGEQATNLSDVPNKMGAMVGQYKKVANIKSNISIPSKKTITITTNLSFIPSIIIADIDNLSGNDFSINSLNQTNYSNGIYMNDCVWWIQDITKDKFDIVTGGGSPSGDLKLKNIIAIE